MIIHTERYGDIEVDLENESVVIEDEIRGLSKELEFTHNKKRFAIDIDEDYTRVLTQEWVEVP